MQNMNYCSGACAGLFSYPEGAGLCLLGLSREMYLNFVRERRSVHAYNINVKKFKHFVCSEGTT